MGVGIGRGAAHEARVAEEIRRAPEQLHAGGLLQGLRVGHDGLEILVRLGQRGALGRDVAIMETPEGRADLLIKLEGRVHAHLGDGKSVLRRRLPLAHDGAGTEGVRPRAAEGVPVGDAEAQVLGHGLAADFFVGVVVFERERVVALRALVGDLGETGEVLDGFRGLGGFGHGVGWVQGGWKRTGKTFSARRAARRSWPPRPGAAPPAWCGAARSAAAGG